VVTVLASMDVFWTGIDGWINLYKLWLMDTQRWRDGRWDGCVDTRWKDQERDE
jgi:hypothetical protein